MSEGIDEPDRPETRAGEGRDLFSKFDDLIAMREGLLSTGQEDPFNLVMEKVLSPTRAICNGRDTILLGTYNYMGMSFDEDVIAAGKQALEDYGSGTTGSRVLNGTYQGHREVDRSAELVLWNDLAAVGRDLIFRWDNRYMALFAKPRNELFEENARFRFIWFQDEPDAHMHVVTQADDTERILSTCVSVS